MTPAVPPEQPSVPGRQHRPAGYERPEVEVLGTLAQLTLGIVPTKTDGVLPGSLI